MFENLDVNTNEPQTQLSNFAVTQRLGQYTKKKKKKKKYLIFVLVL